MTGMIELLIWPFLACVVLVGIHVYFGYHVIKRGIIFVDLSLAQVAALGTTLAFLLGFELDGSVAYWFSLGFALFGAVIFAFTRDIEGKIPQEAIIGIVYAVSSAASIMAVSHSPEGAEHIKFLLIGSLLTVSPTVVIKTAVVYSLVGLFHIFMFKRFLGLTLGQEKTPTHKALWEFLFYASFGIVVTSSVKICGVLLVFIFLVVPSVFSSLCTEGVLKHLLFGWVFGLMGSAAGLLLSFYVDTPPAATIVCTFGAMLLLYTGLRFLGVSKRVA